MGTPGPPCPNAYQLTCPVMTGSVGVSPVYITGYISQLFPIPFSCSLPLSALAYHAAPYA